MIHTVLDSFLEGRAFQLSYNSLLQCIGVHTHKKTHTHTYYLSILGLELRIELG